MRRLGPKSYPLSLMWRSRALLPKPRSQDWGDMLTRAGQIAGKSGEETCVFAVQGTEQSDGLS